MWHYLYFTVLVKVKDPTEFTGPESYVHEMVKVNNLLSYYFFDTSLIPFQQQKIIRSYLNYRLQQHNLEWFPRLQAISLAVEKEEGEQNEWRTLHNQLEGTQALIKTLSSQLSELRDQMTEQRKQKQRIGLLNNAPSLLNLGLHPAERC